MNPLFLFLLLQASERIYNLSFSFGDVILFNVGTIEKLILIKRPPDYYKLFFCFRSSILLSMAFEVAKKVVFETESLIELTSVSYKEYQKRNEKKKIDFHFFSQEEFNLVLCAPVPMCTVSKQVQKCFHMTRGR